MDDDNKTIGEGGYYADKKVLVITISHAIIEPHAVMVEVSDAAITDSAVLAGSPAITVAVCAIKNVLRLPAETDVSIHQ